MLLRAIAAPTEALPPVLLVPAAIDTATPPASALILEPSEAATLMSPSSLVATRLAPLIDASMVPAIVLYEPAPAPDSATAVSLPPAKVKAPPMLSAPMLAVESASSSTSPAAFTVEASI